MTEQIIDPDAPAEVVDDTVTNRLELVREERFAPGDPAVNAAVVAMALVHSFGVSNRSNGLSLSAKIEIDPAYLLDFNDCIGQSTWLVKVGKKAYGETRITGISTKYSEADGVNHTSVGLLWAENQRSWAREVQDLVGKSVRLELWEVQLVVFGKIAE